MRILDQEKGSARVSTWHGSRQGVLKEWTNRRWRAAVAARSAAAVADRESSAADMQRKRSAILTNESILLPGVDYYVNWLIFCYEELARLFNFSFQVVFRVKVGVVSRTLR